MYHPERNVFLDVLQLAPLTILEEMVASYLGTDEDPVPTSTAFVRCYNVILGYVLCVLRV